MSGVLTFGETMGLAAATQIGTLATHRDYTLGFGGAESNVAVGLRRLGTPTRWISRLGADGLGELIRRELRAEGVDVSADTDTTRPTGFMLKERRTAFHTAVTYYRAGSAAAAISPADIPDDAIADADLIHATGITPALSDSAYTTTIDVLQRAKAAGKIVSFDLNYRSKLWNADTAAACYREILPLVDIVFAGVEEAQLLHHVDGHDDLLEHLGSHGPNEIVLKLGGDGARLRTTDLDITLPAVAVPVLDTVGAGDAFVAGYLAERVANAPLEQCLHTATMTGAFACTMHGDWEAAPTRADLTRMQATEAVER